MAQTLKSSVDPIGALASLDNDSSDKTPGSNPSILASATAPNSADILANLEKRYNDILSPKNQIENQLQKAHAWTLYNKSPAFKDIATQEEQQSNQVQNIGTTIAQIKMMQDQIKNINSGFNRTSASDASGTSGASNTPGASSGWTYNGIPLTNMEYENLKLNGTDPAKFKAAFGKTTDIYSRENAKIADEKRLFDWIKSQPPEVQEMLKRNYFPEIYKPTEGVTASGEKYNIPPLSQTSVATPPPTTPPPTTPPPTTPPPTTPPNSVVAPPSGVTLPPNVSSGPGPRVNPQTGLIEHHNGYDIMLAANTPVTVKTDELLSPLVGGKVIDVKPTEASGGFGNTAVIRGTDGKDYRLAHFNNVGVKPGDTITPDTIIGVAGNTGKSRGNHLHIEEISKTQAPAATVAPTTPKTPKTQTQIEIDKAKRIAQDAAVSEGAATEFKTMGKSAADEATQTMDNWHTAQTTINNAKETKLLADRNKATLGVFKKAGPGVAIANTLNEGLKIGPFGEIRVPLEELAKRLVPGTSDQAIRDQERLVSLLGDQNFQFVRMNKNQGSWSDMERKAVSGIIGSVSNSAEFLSRRADLLELRGNFDQKLGDAWRAYKKEAGEEARYSKFQNTDAYENAVKDYKTSLRNNFSKEYAVGQNDNNQSNTKDDEVLNRWKKNK